MSPLASEDDDWLDRVRVGHFAAIPHAPTWLQSARLADLINGYAASRALGLGDLHGWANEREDEAARTGSWGGTALELWLCLFYEHRRWRHFGCEPEGQDRELAACLWRQLRGKLQTIGEEECAIILAQIAASSAEVR
ncbi:hypothetical protein [Bosea sp. BH3]|uniref:hypothetical protein n=1 Tax=Bosea sp. BH3 TaxID=2871701 RepID=UPI0021CB6A55|nr:hypothetical protein [Bosea sp. BH3]MCU4181782.1 hypothetical protein [Bosea sp. BH3]